MKIKTRYKFLLCILLIIIFFYGKTYFDSKAQPADYAAEGSEWLTLSGEKPPEMQLLFYANYLSLSDQCMDAAPMFHPTQSGFHRAQRDYRSYPETKDNSYIYKVPLTLHKGSCDWKLSSLKVFRVRQNEKWDKILTLFLPYSDFEIEKSLKENTSIDCTQWRTDDDYPYGDILQCKARNIESGEEIEGVYNTETPWLHLNTNRFRNVTVNFKPIVKLERNCAGDVVVVE